MVIRQWRTTDREALAELAKCDPESESSRALLAALGSPEWLSPFDPRDTLVAADGDVLIGIGTLWEHDLHPARWRVSMHGRPEFWSQESAEAMLSGLRDLRPDDRPLQTAASARDAQRCEFFQNHGFSMLMRTRSGILPPGAIPDSVAIDFDDARQRTEAERVRTVSVPAIRRMKDSYDQLARLHAAIYEQGHQWNPVRPLTDAEAAEMFLESDELVPEATYIALRRKQMIAVSSLRRIFGRDVVELGWTGAILGDQRQRRDLVYTLLGACLRHATSENWPVSFEVDEADSIMWEMTERLPLEREPDWLTFAEDGSGLPAV